MSDSVIMWVYVSRYIHPKVTHTYTLKKRGKCQKISSEMPPKQEAYKDLVPSKLPNFTQQSYQI